MSTCTQDNPTETVYFVTGATDGIGKATALQMYLRRVAEQGRRNKWPLLLLDSA